MMATITRKSFGLIHYLLLHIGLVTLGACDDVFLEIQRSVARDGFHRNILTNVILQPDDVFPAHQRPCSLLLIEMLPPALYVDTYQLEAAAQFGGPQVLADRPVDMEAPEYLSEAYELYVYTPLPSRISSSESFSVTVTLPVHVRYLRPSPDAGVTAVPVQMHHPRVLLNCSRKHSRLTEAPCDVHNTSLCIWAEVTYKTDSHLLVLSVPVGHEGHVYLVVYGTMVVTVISCTFLLYVIALYDQWKIKEKKR